MRRTYNVTLRRVRATIVAVEKQCVLTTLVCVCSLTYPACNAHAPNCHLWLHPLYIFPHYLTEGKNCEKKNTEHKMCFDFLYNFYLKHFSFEKEMSEM